MAALAFALSLFLLALAMHVVWWRWQLPRHHTAALLFVFTLPPLIAAGLWFGWDCRFGLSWPDLPGVALFHAVATGCYLITYAGVEETSPSLVIIRALEQAGTRGCSPEDLGSCLTEERFILPRLRALQRDGLVASTNTGAVLTPRGLRIARLVNRLARIFNLPQGA